MAFTGDLELLNIVDIIQLLSSTRKSGTFSVNGPRGESRIIFSNGYIVGASHLNNRIRIGTVLVKMGAISSADLEQALEEQKHAGKERMPLMVTLIELGKLKKDQAAKGLKKLIEMTLVELIGWKEGTFTLDTDAIAVSSECAYPIVKMEQEIGLDAQILLMDALRVFDERERDRQHGQVVPSDEELFADVIPSTGPMEGGRMSVVISEDDLGLADLDHLERKMPEYSPVNEVFDPVELIRQKIKVALTTFPAEQQEAFVSFLERSLLSRGAREAVHTRGGRSMSLLLFSEDELTKQSMMTIFKEEGVLVFATDGEEELDRILDQCLKMKIMPVLVFDAPGTPEKLLSREKIVSLRRKARERYPLVSVIQLTSPVDYYFTLQSFNDGIKRVFPRPLEQVGKETFIEDTITFLGTFKSYFKDVFFEERDSSLSDSQLGKLRDHIQALRELDEPSAVSLALLENVSEVCER
ncbi:MAG TPA: DUF4388 domain-containing protein, partial [Thermodesulfovibrionales bacterium]|nr:DUF4388 domain-containing protein [Thermodesulfovibrionales bacterium]